MLKSNRNDEGENEVEKTNGREGGEKAHTHELPASVYCVFWCVGFKDLSLHLPADRRRGEESKRGTKQAGAASAQRVVRVN